MKKNKINYLIIGGGIIGASIAYNLAEQGAKDVMLVEKDSFSSGSTGKCIGGVRQQFSDETTIRIMMEGIRLLKKYQDTDWDIDFEQSGYLLLAYSELEENAFKKNIKLQKSLGLDVDFVDVDAVKKIIPGINTDGIRGGAYCELDGQLDPFRLNYMYLKRAKELGVEVLLRTKVTKINVENNQVKSVVLSNGEKIEVEVVINAAGPHAKKVAELTGVSIPAEPERHESLVTEKVNRFFKPMLVDFTAEHGVYFQQKVNGTIIACFTQKEPLKGICTDSSSDFLSDITGRMVRLLPCLKDVHVVREWAGCYTMSPDGKPIVGESNVKGFFVAGAFCGHGLMLAAGTGKLIAQLLLTGKSDIDISEYALNRFEKGGEGLKKEFLK